METCDRGVTCKMPPDQAVFCLSTIGASFDEAKPAIETAGKVEEKFDERGD